MLGALLGGLAGILFPTAGAAATKAATTGIGALLSRAALPALGAGLGTLATGGGGKDAIRNALMFGAGTAMLPGAVQGIRESGFGQDITGGMASLFGMGGQGGAAAAAPTVSASNTRPRPRPEGLGALPLTAQPMPDQEQFSGVSDMEADARGRMPTTLPTLDEMADIDATRSQRRAAGGFDIAQMFPPVQAERPTFDDEIFIGAPGFESRSGLPFDIDEYLSRRPMTMLSDVQSSASDRYRASGVGTPEANRSAIDFLIASREGRRIPREALIYDPSRFQYAEGGAVEGPGTGTSDSIPAEIYQDGKPVQRAKLSDGEFVMTAAAVKGAGNGDRNRGISRMYELMRRFESGEMA